MPKERVEIKDACYACGQSVAELSRVTGIGYPRLSGWVNGYWEIKPQEEKQIMEIIKQWKEGKNEN